MLQEKPTRDHHMHTLKARKSFHCWLAAAQETCPNHAAQILQPFAFYEQTQILVVRLQLTRSRTTEGKKQGCSFLGLPGTMNKVFGGVGRCFHSGRSWASVLGLKVRIVPVTRHHLCKALGAFIFIRRILFLLFTAYHFYLKSLHANSCRPVMAYQAEFLNEVTSAFSLHHLIMSRWCEKLTFLQLLGKPSRKLWVDPSTQLTL